MERVSLLCISGVTRCVHVRLDGTFFFFFFKRGGARDDLCGHLKIIRN